MPKRAPKRARDDVVKKNEEAPTAANSLMTALMRRGSVSVLEALEVELPEVLKMEVIKKHLPLDATLNLAKVSKWCRDAVWSPETVHKWHRTQRSYYSIRWQSRASVYPLETAVRSGNLPAIKAMIEDGGFDVNEQTEYMALAMDYSCSWHTPLHLAAMYGQPKVMRLLVEAGADVDAYDSNGNTPLLIAAEQRRTDVVMELIKLGADVNRKKRPRFATPLHAAVLRMDMGSVVALLTAGADVNAVVDGKYLVQTPDTNYYHSSSEEKEHLNRGCFTPLDILGFKCSTGLQVDDSLYHPTDGTSETPEVNPARYDDYVRYLQAFHKASVSDWRMHCDMTAFSTLDPENMKHGAELRKDAPRPNVYDVGQGSDWFQSLTSMNLILTQAGAKRRLEIKQSDDLADEE
jgi:hypothetical protein